MSASVWACDDLGDDHDKMLERLGELEQWACHKDVVWWQPRVGAAVLATDMTSWDRPLCSPHWRLHDVIGNLTMLSQWEIHPGARNLWVFFEALGHDGSKLRRVVDEEYPWSDGRERWNDPIYAALAIAARRGYWRGLQ